MAAAVSSDPGDTVTAHLAHSIVGSHSDMVAEGRGLKPLRTRGKTDNTVGDSSGVDGVPREDVGSAPANPECLDSDSKADQRRRPNRCRGTGSARREAPLGSPVSFLLPVPRGAQPSPGHA